MPGKAPLKKSLPLEDCAKALERSGQYRILRRLPDLKFESRRAFSHERVVAIIDTETTGLDSEIDEVIEFAGIAFAYNEKGQLTEPLEVISQLQEPTIPLPQEISLLTGISQSMLKGKSFEFSSIDKFVEAADLIVAHNATFDRPFCEKISKSFCKKPWACSATEIDWKALGFEGTKLAYLVNQSGWFFDAHRALDDCNALSKVLSTHSPRKAPSEPPSTPFAELLVSAREIRWKISFSAPYGSRMALRQRSFRWSPGREGVPGKWSGEFSESTARDLITWLTDTMDINQASISVEKTTAFDRYRK